MRVTLTQQLVSDIPLTGLLIERDIDWPPLLGIPTSGSSLILEGQVYDVLVTTFVPHGVGPFAIIRLHDERLGEPEVTLEEWAAVNRKGWTIRA